jgi:hypothetical protein
MILTDNILRPSERLIEILNSYFLTKGYVFNKTKKCFQKKFENRIESVYPDFINRYSLVNVGIYFTLTFPEIWNISKKIANSKKRNVEDTIGVSILNYPFRITEHSSFALYDTESGEYNDITLNLASKKFIETFELYIEPFFEKINSLKSLDLEMNSLPIKRTFLCHPEKHFTIGLILTKILNPTNLETIYGEYKNYIINSQYTDKDKFKIKLHEIKNLIKELEI